MCKCRFRCSIFGKLTFFSDWKEWALWWSKYTTVYGEIQEADLKIQRCLASGKKLKHVPQSMQVKLAIRIQQYPQDTSTDFPPDWLFCPPPHQKICNCPNNIYLQAGSCTCNRRCDKVHRTQMYNCKAWIVINKSTISKRPGGETQVGPPSERNPVKFNIGYSCSTEHSSGGCLLCKEHLWFMAANV